MFQVNIQKINKKNNLIIKKIVTLQNKRKKKNYQFDY